MSNSKTDPIQWILKITNQNNKRFKKFIKMITENKNITNADLKFRSDNKQIQLRIKNILS